MDVTIQEMLNHYHTHASLWLMEPDFAKFHMVRIMSAIHSTKKDSAIFNNEALQEMIADALRSNSRIAHHAAITSRYLSVKEMEYLCEKSDNRLLSLLARNEFAPEYIFEKIYSVCKNNDSILIYLKKNKSVSDELKNKIAIQIEANKKDKQNDVSRAN